MNWLKDGRMEGWKGRMEWHHQAGMIKLTEAPSNECENRSQEPGARRQEPGARSQAAGARS